MSRRRSQLQAYLAGIVDGEGSFGIYDLASWQGRFTVNMQDPEALLLFMRLYPEGTLARYRRPGTSHPAYIVTYSQHRAYRVVRELIPFLLVKQRQAKILLSFLVHRRRSPDHQRKNQGLHQCPRCRALAEKLLTLRQQSKGVNSVNALASHGLRQYRAKREEVEQDLRIMHQLLEGVETRDRARPPVEPMSAPEQEIVREASQAA